MAKNKISEWSSTPANNTDVGGIDIAEGCAPSGINNAIREVMAQVKDMITGADGDSQVVGGNLTVNGTTTLSTALPVTSGGTGAATAGDARTNLGLGTIATQASNNVTITGGSITGITDLAVADGGTGASTLSANAVLLGNGTSALQTVAPSTSGNVLTSNGTTWTSAPLSFDKSLTTNGYQKFPSGLIIQWGTTNSLGSQNVTFPIAFTTTVFQIQRTNVFQSGSGGSESILSGITTTGFTISQKGFDTYTGAQTYYWFAIGY